MARLVLATCQFHVHKQPERNLRSAINQIETAKARGAHLVHFSEACLSGYLGLEVNSHDRGDWDRVTAAMEEVMAAASNYFAVSANNGTRRHAWPSFVVNAEGMIVNKARAHRPAVLITEIDTRQKLYDASADWRDRCMRGVLHSGRLVRDAHSRNRAAL